MPLEEKVQIDLLREYPTIDVGAALCRDNTSTSFLNDFHRGIKPLLQAKTSIKSHLLDTL